MIYPLSQGKHNNLHFMFTIGNRRKPIVRVRVVGFFDTEKAYILSSKLKCPIEFLNVPNIIEKLRNDLLEHDFVLETRSENDLLLPDTTSEGLLEFNQKLI